MPITTTAAKAAAQQAASGTYSITVTDTGEAGPSTVSGTPSQTLTRGYTQQIQIIWTAEDPDGDKLTYSLYFRGEDESDWKLIRGNFSDTIYTLEGDVLADGRYLFRLIASDKPSNAGEASRQAELVSAPVLFDATPPVVTAANVVRTGAAATITLRAVDTASALRRAEYSLDATAWIPIDSTDGVVDGREEEFQLGLEALTPGEHILVVRAYDASNNVGLTKVILR
jgi:flavin-binding protein dodecin